MEVSKQQFIEAQKTISKFNEQESLRKKIIEMERLKNQKEREDSCDEHRFVDGPKWTSYRKCMFCGKEI